MEYYNAMYTFKNAANENNDLNMYHLVICHINEHAIIVLYVHMHSMIIFWNFPKQIFDKNVFSKIYCYPKLKTKYIYINLTLKWRGLDGLIFFTWNCVILRVPCYFYPCMRKDVVHRLPIHLHNLRHTRDKVKNQREDT